MFYCKIINIKIYETGKYVLDITGIEKNKVSTNRIDLIIQATNNSN